MRKEIKCTEALSRLYKGFVSAELKEECEKLKVVLTDEDIENDILKYKGDLFFVDTETTGLDPNRNRLCKVQMLVPKMKTIFLIDILPTKQSHLFPVLCEVLTAQEYKKVFHSCMLDVAFLRVWCGENRFLKNVECTYAASHCIKGTGEHGFRDQIKDLLGVDIDKKHQRSYWGEPIGNLSASKIEYMTGDVFFLYLIYGKLMAAIKYEGQTAKYQAIVSTLNRLVKLESFGCNPVSFFTR